MPSRFRSLRMLALATLGTFALPQAPSIPASHPPCVSLPGTEARKVISKAHGREYHVQIALPSGYGTAGRTYPVIYLLDGDYHFGFVKALLESLQMSGSAPEAILVGIGYGPDSPADLTRKRERDFLVAPAPGPFPGESGQAAAFLAFLSEELLPTLETAYRAKAGDRTLMGMSAGAIFASHVLAVSPELFHRYVIVSPYFVGGQEAVLGEEAAAAKGRKDLKARVFTALGEPELPVASPSWKAYFDALEQPRYPGLTVRREVLKGLDHFEMPYLAYLDGLKSVFGIPRPLGTSPDQHVAMAGRYFLSLAGLPITISQQGNRLWVDFGPGPMELEAVSDTRFTIKGNPSMRFAFLPGENGQADTLLFNQMGFDVAARRMVP